MNKYKLVKGEVLVIEHDDSWGCCTHEVNVSTIMRILKPLLGGNSSLTLNGLVKCKQCGIKWPSAYIYCPDCGEELPEKGNHNV
jgi:hypothetical protein